MMLVEDDTFLAIADVIGAVVEYPEFCIVQHHP